MRQALQSEKTDRALLLSIAHRATVEHGLEPDRPTKVVEELASIQSQAGWTDGLRDLGDRVWASIDNDDFRDPDQLAAAESLDNGRVRILADMVRNFAVAMLLSGGNAELFDAIVTGASDQGTWVRLSQPPTECRLERGFQGLDVGDQVRVKLDHADIERGFIDFVPD